MAVRQDEQSKWKQFLPLIITGVLALGVGGYATVVSTQHAQTLSKQEAQIVQLKNQVDVAQSESETIVKRVKSQATGIEADRVDKDNRIATDFLKEVFTWKSYDEYNAIRDKMMSNYAMTKDSSFLKVFMPEIYNENLNGKNYNRIDVDHYNITFKSLDSYVTNVDRGNYTYFTFVTASSKTDDGEETPFTVAMSYTITDKGSILNIEGYAL